MEKTKERKTCPYRKKVAKNKLIVAGHDRDRLRPSKWSMITRQSWMKSRNIRGATKHLLLALLDSNTDIRSTRQILLHEMHFFVWRLRCQVDSRSLRSQNQLWLFHFCCIISCFNQMLKMKQTYTKRILCKQTLSRKLLFTFLCWKLRKILLFNSVVNFLRLSIFFRLKPRVENAVCCVYFESANLIGQSIVFCSKFRI